MGGSGIRRGIGRTIPAREDCWRSAREPRWRPTWRPRQQRAGFDSLARTIGVTRRPRWQRDAPAHSVGVRATRLSSTLASPAAMASAPWPNSPNAPSTVWWASRGLPEGTMGGPTGPSLPSSTDSVWGGRASVRTEDGATSHRVPRWSSDAHTPVPRLPRLSPNERGVAGPRGLRSGAGGVCTVGFVRRASPARPRIDRFAKLTAPGTAAAP